MIIFFMKNKKKSILVSKKKKIVFIAVHKYLTVNVIYIHYLN